MLQGLTLCPHAGQRHIERALQQDEGREDEKREVRWDRVVHNVGPQLVQEAAPRLAGNGPRWRSIVEPLADPHIVHQQREADHHAKVPEGATELVFGRWLVLGISFFSLFRSRTCHFVPFFCFFCFLCNATSVDAAVTEETDDGEPRLFIPATKEQGPRGSENRDTLSVSTRTMWPGLRGRSGARIARTARIDRIACAKRGKNQKNCVDRRNYVSWMDRWNSYCRQVSY